MTLVDYINQQRERRGWSIRELASHAGISFASLSKNLKGDSVPKLRTVEKVAEALEVDKLFLFGLLLESNYGVVPESSFAPSARLVAKRLSALPESVREELAIIFCAALDVVARLCEEPNVKDKSQ